MNPLVNSDELTPERLTNILRSEGYLTAGRVESINITSSRPVFTSTIAFLDIAYSSAASAALPTKLFLKFAKPDNTLGPELSLQNALNEENYYRKVAPRTDRPPSMGILDVQVDIETGHYHLLMSDVSASHFMRTGLPPTQAECERLFGVLARFHAQWWNHPDLGAGIAPVPQIDHVVYGLGIERFRAGIPVLADLLGEFLSPTRCRTYERILDVIPKFRDLRGRKRMTEGGHLTLVHEDAHGENIFHPRDPDAHEPFLVDWQDCRVQMGTNDLATFISWHPERRQRLERPLLEHYHRTLIEAGVTDYAWDDCWHDYRFSALRNMLKIPFYVTIGLADAGWNYQMMQHSFLNFEELNLEEFL